MIYKTMTNDYQTPRIMEYDVQSEGQLCVSFLSTTTDNVSREEFVW